MRLLLVIKQSENGTNSKMVMKHRFYLSIDIMLKFTILKWINFQTTFNPPF